MKGYLKPIKPAGYNVKPYLPYIADLFTQDIAFLSSKSEYFLNHLRHFLELYNFLYCSQLALNIKNFKFDEPKTRPLYFILDTEKASLDRTHIHNDGYKHLYSAFGAVFPTLSMLENINNMRNNDQVVPLWQYVQTVENDIQPESVSPESLAKAIQSFANHFQNKRNIRERDEVELCPKNQIQRLFQYAQDQFDISRGGTLDRHNTCRVLYPNEFVKHIGKSFIQSRGRSSRVLAINQDFLLLLTNLAIGDEQQLRFQKLLQSFRQRGVYFDKQSEQALIAFYERVGNVDRMSDSGDAVYVRSTI